MDSEQMKSAKCVVWDLDNTLWNGVLLEDPTVSLRPGVRRIIETLDDRGVLQSIASRNDFDIATARLNELNLAEYFVYPQIQWDSKVVSLRTIAEALNIGIDTLAFVDDDPVQRAEVSFALPEVLCLDAADLRCVLDHARLNPVDVTEDAKRRRLMYLQDQQRKDAQSQFVGPTQEFLATLQMQATIAPATKADLKRAQELTVRTHQLNTTGRSYSLQQLDEFRRSDEHLLLMVTLTDRFGSYGRIGLVLVDCQPDLWTIRLFLMSCRVMGTGIGAVVLNHVMRLAHHAHVRLQADFVPNKVNRMMYVTYSFAGFKPVQKEADSLVLETDLAHLPPCPDYVKLSTTPSA